jgi:hypothetical protein
MELLFVRNAWPGKCHVEVSDSCFMQLANLINDACGTAAEERPLHRMDVHGPITGQPFQHSGIHSEELAQIQMDIADVPPGFLVGVSDMTKESIDNVSRGWFPPCFRGLIAIKLDTLPDL